MWMPLVLASLPALLTGDTMDQLSQYFHLETSWSIDSINLISEDMYINKHHSVLHTLVLGFIYKTGWNIHSFNFGALIYTILQLTLVITIFVFMIKYMRKIKINKYIVAFSVLFIGLNPTIITFAVCAIKDTPSALFNLLYVIFLLQIVRNYDSVFKNKKRLIVLIITIMMMLLLRNNGIYTFLLSFPCLFILYRKKWKKIILVLLIPLLMFRLYDKVLLPSFDISDGSIRETLSVPLMQLSRVVHYKPDVFNDKDKEKINKVFNFYAMQTVYDPDIADPVKKTFNKDATTEDLMGFFSVWFKYLKKYPGMYIASFLNSTYGYFYPEKNIDALTLYRYNLDESAFFNLSNFYTFDSLREIYNKLLFVYYKVPFFMNSVAAYDWFLMFSCLYVILKKKFKYLIPLMPLVATLMSCFLSPVNGSFRYIMPIIFSVPIILSIDYMVYRDSKNDLST